MLNTMIGGSSFGLPSLIVARLGRWSTLTYCVAAVGVGSIAATLAEVSSQFRASGGVYLYARAAFGRFVGIQIGWLIGFHELLPALLSQISSFRTWRNVYPQSRLGWCERAVLVALISFLGAGPPLRFL